MAGKRNPWGKPSSSGSDGGSGDDGGEGDPPDNGGDDGDAPRGPRNPWLPPSRGGDGPRRSASIEDIFRSRGPEGPRRTGGGGGGGFRLPQRPGNGKLIAWVAVGLVAGWLVFTSTHEIQPKEQGLVTWVGGKYSHKLLPGLNFTLPWPIQEVTVANVSQIRSEKIGGDGERLLLTGDQNLVDLSYVIRWNIKNLPRFAFQLDDPELTIREVAEAAMRAAVAEQKLDDVISGAGRGDIETSVRARMQQLLDAYHAGVQVQGVAIEKADPPTKVIDAFKDVSAAQQDADAMRNRARAYAQQVRARSEGDAASFDRIYAQYKLAPEVTKRRMYYETMESVLSKTNKTVIEAPGVTSYLPLPELRRNSAAKSDQDTSKQGGQ
ncbi:protease modulator HflK [Porphyrobacter algicida]|uniref:Protease modulator HflK n=2 Tax=Qipengyuania algicida TaxID=1836209 RepID=A0A845AL64_9SPHN|nr:protease modulator HflK [Qipengyuania algicida]